MRNKFDLKIGKWTPSGEKSTKRPRMLISTKETGDRLGDGEKYIYLGEKENSGHYVYYIVSGRISKISDRKYHKLKAETRAIPLSRPTLKEKSSVDKLMSYNSWYGKEIESSDLMEDYLKHDLDWFIDDNGYREQIHAKEKIIYGLVNNEDNAHKLRKRFGDDLNLKAIGEDIYLFSLNKKTTENKVGLLLLDIGFTNNFRGKNILKDEKRTFSYCNY